MREEYYTKTYKQLCEERGIKYATFLRRMNSRKWTMAQALNDEPIPKGAKIYKHTSFEFEGEVLTLAEISRRLGVSRNTLVYRLNGMNLEPSEAFRRDKYSKSVKVAYRGKEWTLKELAEEYNITYSALYKRLQRGKSLEEALRR